jgi:hypothetical protein
MSAGAHAFFMDYTQGERAITHHAGLLGLVGQSALTGGHRAPQSIDRIMVSLFTKYFLNEK